MTNSKSAILFLTIAILGFTLCGCEESQEAPDSVLTVSVLAIDNTIQSGAIVKIYADQEDFLHEERQIRSGITDQSGQVIFTGLALDRVFYVDVKSRSKTNWIDQTKTELITEGQNEMTIQIQENWYSNLSSASGTSWSPTQVSFDSLQWRPYFECFTDNVYRFYKNQEMSHVNNTSCQPGEINSFVGTWFGTENVVRMEADDNRDYLTFKLIMTSPDEFIGKIRNMDSRPAFVLFQR